MTTGDVTAASGYGIVAHKDAGTGNTTITANNITQQQMVFTATVLGAQVEYP